jgi:transcriptional regulator with XRE-family HTH domain
MKRLGKRIACLRKNANLRQWQVAERCGVSIQAVSKWETGLNCPDLLLLDDLAAVLGVEIKDLFVIDEVG